MIIKKNFKWRKLIIIKEKKKRNNNKLLTDLQSVDKIKCLGFCVWSEREWWVTWFED